MAGGQGTQVRSIRRHGSGRLACAFKSAQQPVGGRSVAGVLQRSRVRRRPALVGSNLSYRTSLTLSIALLVIVTGLALTVSAYFSSRANTTLLANTLLREAT